MSFEEHFFGPGNRLRWDAIASGRLPLDTQRRLGPFLEEFRKNLPYVLLPRVDQDGRVEWYVLCSSARACRLARDELRAFLGQSYSDFEGRPPDLDPTDPVDAAVLATYPGTAFKVEVPDRDLLEHARERLRLLMQVRQERPTRTRSVPRAVGRILRDFEYALLAGDVVTASDLIKELRSAGHLDALNLLFLEVRRLAVGFEWRGILSLPGLDALLRIRRPRRVTEAIISAVFNTYLAEFVPDAQASAAIDRFRAEVAPRFSSLYWSKEGLRGLDVAVSFMVSAVASDPQRFAVAESILADATHIPPVELNFINALAGLLRRPDSGRRVELSDAAAAFSIGDLDSAFAIAVAQPASFRRTAILLRCAREIGTLEVAGVALEAARGISLDELPKLETSASLRSALEYLQELLATPVDGSQMADAVPRNWAEWLQRLNRDQSWSNAVAVAEAGAVEWSRDELRKDAVQVQLCADLLLAERSPGAQVALRNATPYLIEFVLTDEPDARLMPLYDSLFLLLCVDADLSVAQVTQIARICAARLQIGLNASDYTATVRQLSDAIAAVETPAVLDVALEVFELLIVSACPNSTERFEFAVKLGNLMKRWFRRADQTQFLLFNSLALDVDAPTIAASREEVDKADDQSAPLWTGLSGKAIALYSLQESALRRAASIIERLTGARVGRFSDHVGGSPALRSAAMTSDVFVLATSAAKHSATTFIQDRRPKDAVTLFARGQGSASLVQALRDHVLQRRSLSSLV
jgi:hypothetical protein